MKVYYDSSLRSKDKGPSGLVQRTNWQFEYYGTRRCIPVIYRFSKGIVFDIITFLDETKVREFFKKYEALEGKLTPLQRRCAYQEHPYKALSVKEIWINGRRVEGGYSSSGTVSLPWVRQDDGLETVGKAYSHILKDTVCFACERFCVPYPETGSIIKKLKRFFRLERVDSMKLSTHPVQWFYLLDIHFEMSAEENQKEVCFKHPTSGATHRLYFQNAEHVEIPLGPDGDRKFHLMQSMYEIEPALPKSDTLQFNSSTQYTEIPTAHHTKSCEDRFSPRAASSIGIIGGADGPTAIFVGGKDQEKKVPCGLHGLPLHSCFSVPGFDREATADFVLEGINIKNYDSRDYFF